MQIDFQAALTQLGRQNYQLDQVQVREIQLKKTIGDPVTLKIAKHDLVLDGAHHGRVLLLHGIDDLRIDNFGTYQLLTVFYRGHEKASGTLFLPNTKQAIVEKG
ncbi:hypothetical protein [Fructobacillus cardui]|uniref:hypothetical protein n=1 Tax=Fructobacillus cardui TaxID=2893170 RepID=UPI00200ACF08|nr:hypothetical protein [Fructobacillus cardui]MCK8626951.1 hypothetical protein [Fructobacillus cardui]